jgi:rRNA-processing protein FCF1
MPDKPFADPLVRHRLFPEAAQIFAFRPIPLIEAIKDALIVVDTNVLLIPYGTGPASLDQIREVLQRLVAENRVRVPAQVAREFAENRVERLKTVYQQLSRKRDTNLSRSEYPLFEQDPAYIEVCAKEAQIIAALQEYRKSIAGLLERIAAWQWDDPVANLYRSLFTPELVVDPQFDREELLRELAYRHDHRIPPGYKDAANQYSGIGDLLIWKSILQVGQQEHRHMIFVSGDEKTDWRYQSENRTLYPRFELVDEYRTASKGKSFLIINFAELLQQFGASTTVVEEVRKEQVASVSVPAASADASAAVPLTLKAFRAYLSRRYPTRERVDLATYREVLHELRQVGISSVDELNRALEEAEQIFEYEEEGRVASRKGRFADVGAVRVSLRGLGYDL